MQYMRLYVVTTHIPALTHSIDMKSQNLQPEQALHFKYYIHLFRDGFLESGVVAILSQTQKAEPQLPDE